MLKKTVVFFADSVSNTKDFVFARVNMTLKDASDAEVIGKLLDPVTKCGEYE